MTTAQRMCEQATQWSHGSRGKLSEIGDGIMDPDALRYSWIMGYETRREQHRLLNIMAMQKRMNWNEVKSYINAAESHSGLDRNIYSNAFGTEVQKYLNVKLKWFLVINKWLNNVYLCVHYDCWSFFMGISMTGQL